MLYEAWNNKGLALLELGRSKEAIECYDRANSHRSKFRYRSPKSRTSNKKEAKGLLGGYLVYDERLKSVGQYLIYAIFLYSSVLCHLFSGK